MRTLNELSPAQSWIMSSNHLMMWWCCVGEGGCILLIFYMQIYVIWYTVILTVTTFYEHFSSSSDNENVPSWFCAIFCRRFGTWPLAIHVGARYRVVLEGPLCRGSQVTGWHTNQRRGVPRRFPIGFSGFAFNSTILWDPQRWNSPTLESIILHSGGRGGLQVISVLLFSEKEKQSKRLYCGFPDRIKSTVLMLSA